MVLGVARILTVAHGGKPTVGECVAGICLLRQSRLETLAPRALRPDQFV